MMQTSLLSIAWLGSLRLIASAQDCLAGKARDELASAGSLADLEGDEELQLTSLLQTAVQLGGTWEDNNTVAQVQAAVQLGGTWENDDNTVAQVQAAVQLGGAVEKDNNTLAQVQTAAQLGGTWENDNNTVAQVQAAAQLGGTWENDDNTVAQVQAAAQLGGAWENDDGRANCMLQMKDTEPQWGDTFKSHFAEGLDQSQCSQSSIIHQAFFGSDVPIKRGTVLEIGAADGFKGSNSYAFEVGLGWRAILIEANPSSARALKQNRPSAEVHAPVAISPSSGHVDFNVCGDPALSHIKGHVDLCRYVTEVIQVPSEPLSSFLEDVPELDILFLDVEGAERMVLETIDWSTTKVKVVNVEAGCPGSEAGDFLQSMGFTYRGNIKSDYVWTWGTAGADSEPAPGGADSEPAPGGADSEPAPGGADSEPAPDDSLARSACLNFCLFAVLITLSLLH